MHWTCGRSLTVDIPSADEDCERFQMCELILLHRHLVFHHRFSENIYMLKIISRCWNISTVSENHARAQIKQNNIYAVYLAAIGLTPMAISCRLRELSGLSISWTWSDCREVLDPETKSVVLVLLRESWSRLLLGSRLDGPSVKYENTIIKHCWTKRHAPKTYFLALWQFSIWQRHSTPF